MAALSFGDDDFAAALLAAALVLLLRAVLRAAGCGEDVSVLVGAAPDGGAPDAGQVAGGVTYVGSWLLLVAAAPVMALGAVIHAVLEALIIRLRRRGRVSTDPGPAG